MSDSCSVTSFCPPGFGSPCIRSDFARGEPPRAESIGRYEGGDTLVVDTIGLQTRNSFLDWFRKPHSEKLHVVERLKLFPDGNALEAVVKVDYCRRGDRIAVPSAALREPVMAQGGCPRQGSKMPAMEAPGRSADEASTAAPDRRQGRRRPDWAKGASFWHARARRAQTN
jgi:hypothetical protein